MALYNLSMILEGAEEWDSESFHEEHDDAAIHRAEAILREKSPAAREAELVRVMQKWEMRLSQVDPDPPPEPPPRPLVVVP